MKGRLVKNSSFKILMMTKKLKLRTERPLNQRRITAKTAKSFFYFHPDYASHVKKVELALDDHLFVMFRKHSL